ncbi:MAG: glutathione synthase [Acutalibacteraceae bacterium]
MYLNFGDKNIQQQMYKGYFGLEKESLRVTENGFISRSPHPFSDNPNIDRDFCESQIEIVTDVFDNIDSLYKQLGDLHKVAVKTLNTLSSGKEYVWSFSNPPFIKNEANIPIAHYNGVLKGKEFYRQYLAKKYGKRKMLFSGIHFNFSLNEDLLKKGFEQSDYADFKNYTNQLYLNLAQRITQYSWLIVWLTAASPVMDGSFLSDEAVGTDYTNNYASARCSEIGYWNDFIPILSYHSLKDYVQSIQSYIQSEQIVSASELYYPVRLKPKGENTLENLETYGVDHIELRMLDLNPLSPIGLIKSDLEFLHLFILFLLSLEDDDFSLSEQISAIKNMKNAAKFNADDIQIELGWNDVRPVKQAAMFVLDRMADFFETHNQEYALQNIEIQKNKILHSSEQRYAEIIRKKFGKDYVCKGLALMRHYAENS